MSVQAITWSLGRASTIASQALLFALANHANEWGVTFAGQDTLASECSCRRPTVTTNMTKLEEDGLIARVRRHDKAGRRTSDIVVLGPLAVDRGEMRDADKTAASMFSDEVCALARQSTADGPRQDSQSTFDDRLGTPDDRLGTPSVHEPSEEPLEEPLDLHQSSSASAHEGDWEFAAELQADGEALLARKVKVDGKLVTEAEMRIAAAALAEWNRQMGSDYGLGAHLKSVVMRIRDRPRWDAAAHVRLVQSAWRFRWWERGGNGRRPAPNVIYSERAFENVVQDAADEAAGRKIVEDLRLDNKVYDGVPWDQLTPTQQAHARESMAMGIKPWERPDEPPVAINGQPRGMGLTADNFLDEFEAA